MNIFLRSLSLSSLAIVALDASAQTYDLDRDFNVATNEGGPFTAGWRSIVAGTDFDRFTNLQELLGFQVRNAGPSHHPALAIQRPDGDNPYYIQATSSELGIHPGENGEVCVVRFTVPETATYRLGYDFELRDSFNEDGRHPADVGAYLLRDGALLDSRQLTEYPQSWIGATTLTLLQGETVEMAIDRGLSGSFGNDWTRADMQVTPVPEPSALAALGLGAVAFVKRRRRA